MTPPDSQLINKILRGDKEAFAQLVTKYKGAVYGLAFHKVKNFADAEDIAQEAFLEAYRCLGNLRDKSKFANWLSSITANRCKMWLRQRRRDVVSLEASIANQDDYGVLQIPDNRPTPDEAYEKKAIRESVMKAIDALPEKQRLVVTLYYIDDLSYKEIADFLGVPVSTVQSRLQVGRIKLKGEMLQMARDVFAEEKLGTEFAEKLLLEAVNLYEQEEECERAIAAAQRVIREYPNSEAAMEAHWLIAQPYKYSRQVDKEIDAIESALRKYPDSLSGMCYQLADAYTRQGNFEKAIEEHHTLMEQFPDDPEPGGSWFMIGRCYELLGQVGKARELYGKVIGDTSSEEGVVDAAKRSLIRLEGCGDISAEKVERLRQLRHEASELFDRQRDYAGAIPIYQKLVEEGAGTLHGVQASIWLGICYELLGQIGETIEAYKKSIEKHLKDTQPWQLTICGMEQERDGNYVGALATYDEIIKIGAQEIWFVERARYRRGQCYEKLGEVEAAKSAYSSLLTGKAIEGKAEWMLGFWIFAAEKALKRLRAKTN